MSFWEICVIAVGLSMDALAVSICKGLSVRHAGLRRYRAVFRRVSGAYAVNRLSAGPAV